MTRKTNQPRRVALYARVSTDGQTVDNQLRELHAAAERHGWTVVETFKDEGISGAKGRNGRPAFDAMLKGVARKDFDMIAAWSVYKLDGENLLSMETSSHSSLTAI